MMAKVENGTIDAGVPSLTSACVGESDSLDDLGRNNGVPEKSPEEGHDDTDVNC